jgi:putative membrane protein
MMWHQSMGGFGWLFMGVVWLVLAGGLIWLVRSVLDRPAAKGGSQARRILDERFAAGELSVEEYEQRRRLLG